jgi:hypothetical protein
MTAPDRNKDNSHFILAPFRIGKRILNFPVLQIRVCDLSIVCLTSQRSKDFQYFRNIEQEVLGRANRILSFDMTPAA